MYRDPETQIIIINLNVSFKASIFDREGVRSLIIPSNAPFTHLTFQWIREHTLCFITDVFISLPHSIYWEMSGLALSLEDTWAMVTPRVTSSATVPSSQLLSNQCRSSGGTAGDEVMLSLWTSRAK